MQKKSKSFKRSALAALVAATAALLAGAVSPAHADLTGPKPPPSNSTGQ